MKLCHPVVFTAAIGHQTTTVKTDGPNKGTLLGSVFHPEMRTFAGVVGRVHDDGSCDLLIFPPNHTPVWVDGAKLGDVDEPGTFALPWADPAATDEPQVGAEAAHVDANAGPSTTGSGTKLDPLPIKPPASPPVPPAPPVSPPVPPVPPVSPPAA
jgi:hypothetical protein